jgi:AraC-like DNA-binding protein
MSPSAFHRQFKALTSMTPLQYQKQMRLPEALHLMVAGAVNAEAAAYQVGYESASQFSREYARMFGAPPRRDIVTLKTALAWPAASLTAQRRFLRLRVAPSWNAVQIYSIVSISNPPCVD